MDWKSDLDAAAARINELRAEGLSSAQIAERMGVTARQFYYLVNKARKRSVSVRRRADNPKACWRQALALHRKGLTRAEIGKRMGATPPQVAFYLHHARQRGAEDVQKMTKARAKNAETRLLSAQSAGWGLRMGFLGATLRAHEADFADWLLQQAERADKTLCDVLVRLAKEKYHDAR
jgi:DNA-binding CsgD family transcriptional regulator